MGRASGFTKKYPNPGQVRSWRTYIIFDRWLNEERVGRHICDVFQGTDPARRHREQGKFRGLLRTCRWCGHPSRPEEGRNVVRFSSIAWGWPTTISE